MIPSVGDPAGRPVLVRSRLGYAEVMAPHPSAETLATARDLRASLQLDGGHVHVHPLFLDREISRHDVRELVKLGLRATQGNYRGMLRLFGIDDRDYKRFMNFLGTHRCLVDFREFRRSGDSYTIDAEGAARRDNENVPV